MAERREACLWGIRFCVPDGNQGLAGEEPNYLCKGLAEEEPCTARKWWNRKLAKERTSNSGTD